MCSIWINLHAGGENSEVRAHIDVYPCLYLRERELRYFENSINLFKILW